LYIQTPEYAPKLRLKISEHLVNRIAATLVGVNIATVQTNNAVVPSVRNIEVIWIWRADDCDGWSHIYCENGGVDARKTRGIDGEATIVVVLSRVEAGIQNFCDAIYERAAESYVDRLIGANPNFKIRDVLIYHNIEVAAVVVGKQNPISSWVTIGCKTTLRVDV
jgi:hypothetical protein